MHLWQPRRKCFNAAALILRRGLDRRMRRRTAKHSAQSLLRVNDNQEALRIGAQHQSAQNFHLGPAYRTVQHRALATAKHARTPPGCNTALELMQYCYPHRVWVLSNHRRSTLHARALQYIFRHHTAHKLRCEFCQQFAEKRSSPKFTY